MFGNKCLGNLKYEATTTAIMMAGMFVTFMMEYIGSRVINSRVHPESDSEVSVASSTQQAHNKDQSTECGLSPEASHHHFAPNDNLSVALLEAGIIFHSISKYCNSKDPIFHFLIE